MSGNQNIFTSTEDPKEVKEPKEEKPP